MFPLMLLFLTLLSAARVARCQNYSSFNNASGANASSTDVLDMEEKMIALRKEMVRLQILSSMNLKESPPPVAQPVTEATREMIRLLLREEEEKSRRQVYRVDDREEKLVIHAKGDGGLPCLQYNGSFCKMFRYELAPNLNMSTVDIWIYKVAALPRWVSVSLTLSSPTEDKYLDSRYYDLKRVGWNKLRLPRINLPSTWNDTVLYSAEVIGQSVEDKGNHQPFLMVSKRFLVPVRRRRDVDCNTNESCCMKPLKFAFAEIGFNWVVYPEEIEANMCTGKCSMDHGEMSTHYERAMTKVLESDSTLHASLGECWTLCCKPKALEPVRVIYNDAVGAVHLQLIPSLSVTSCGCT